MKYLFKAINGDEISVSTQRSKDGTLLVVRNFTEQSRFPAVLNYSNFWKLTTFINRMSEGWSPIRSVNVVTPKPITEISFLIVRKQDSITFYYGQESMTQQLYSFEISHKNFDYLAKFMLEYANGVDYVR